jgi:hypothetical protein
VNEVRKLETAVVIAVTELATILVAGFILGLGVRLGSGEYQ